MKTIRLHKQEGCRVIRYPDGQVSVVVDEDIIDAKELVRVVAPIRNGIEMMELLSLRSALFWSRLECCELVIPYLMAARSDRVMVKGGSFDLDIIAMLINRMNFCSVHLFDVHSNVALELIAYAKNHDNRKLLQYYDKAIGNIPVTLICPDSGATNRIALVKQFLNIENVIYCNKCRDLSTGRIALQVLHPEQCKDKHCVIVDDICDGGATFIAIAKQIQPKSLDLVVSHGIFSRGFKELFEHFNHIYTTDSYYNWTIANSVHCLTLDL